MTDAIARLTAALADRYRVERELGAGGMATVYLARDLRHERLVALKVLRPELGAVLGVERFLSEIKTTASLQHPHILPLFDSGQAEGLIYYVMPHVEGESLRGRLEREKQLPIEEGVEITRAVASALDYAHRHGVIHRDIKPENILFQDGQAVVADFGIALALTAAGGSRLTETGLSLGTPQYMSPEQATGERQIDARTDIYSLGAVLYEMLSGGLPHTGPTVQAIIAQVIADRPRRVTLSRDTVPPHIEAAILKALEKVPADRFQTAAQLIEALTRPSAAPLPAAAYVSAPIPAPAQPVTGMSRRRTLLIAAAVALGMVAGAAGWAWLGAKPPAAPPPVMRFMLRLPEDAGLDVNVRGPNIAVAPDGSRIVYVGRSPTGSRLYQRGVDQLEPTPIPGTDGATFPFFSPDGRWLGFRQQNRLAKAPIAGGPVLRICDVAATVYGASWGPGDTIVFSQGGVGLYAVPAGGGQPRLLVARDSAAGESFRWPEALPDGRAVLFTVRVGNEDRLAVLDRRNGTVKRLEQTGSNPHYVAGGFVVLADLAGQLLTAVRFDAHLLATVGSPIPLAQEVMVLFGGAARVGVSLSGTLVHSTGSLREASRLYLVDRRGTARDLGLDSGFYYGPRLSPDGRRVAVAAWKDASQRSRDVWVYDILQHTRSRLTFDSTAEWATWTPDGARIVYTRFPSGLDSAAADLYWVRADGSSPPEPLTTFANGEWAGSFTPDGRTLVIQGGLWAARVLSLSSVAMDQPDTARTVLASRTSHTQAPSLSPDGRWLAYVSNEAGPPEVFVRPFPGPGGRWQISTDGGWEPMWSPAGREVFYRTGDSMMVAAVVTSPTFEVRERTLLFQGGFSSDGFLRNYDVTRDGQSFLMLRGPQRRPDMMVVLNWFDQLRAPRR